jgi:hypothetical protein
MNDPNGLIQLNGVHHLFYQATRTRPGSSPSIGGHAVSTDWCTGATARRADAGRARHAVRPAGLLSVGLPSRLTAASVCSTRGWRTRAFNCRASPGPMTTR